MGMYAVYARKAEDKDASMELVEDWLTGIDAGKLANKLDAEGYQTIIVGSLKPQTNPLLQTRR